MNGPDGENCGSLVPKGDSKGIEDNQAGTTGPTSEVRNITHGKRECGTVVSRYARRSGTERCRRDAAEACLMTGWKYVPGDTYTDTLDFLLSY